MPTSQPVVIGGVKGGGSAGAGTGGVGNLNAVDITLIVFFSIFGFVLILAVAFFTQRVVFSGASGPTASAPAAAEVKSKSEIQYAEADE
jgi:hypothetical protein